MDDATPPTLTDDDVEVLRALADGAAEPPAVAEAAGVGDATARLDALADAGLVRAAADGYRLTDSGERLLASPGDGSADASMDAPPAVEAALDDMDLRPDQADAVANAYAFLRHWGDASRVEVVDAVFSEHPLGYADADDWWDGAVRDALAALPGIERDGDDWTHAGGGAVDESGDGRRPSASAGGPPFGSVKHALEALDVDDRQRAAVTAAFELLRSRGGATTQDLQERAHDAVTVEASAGTWWRDGVAPVLERLPGVERGEDGRWRYVGDRVD
ncbi:hypothetical protein [Halostella litorea]|uniref:hypothetical protein n=1 Tax=Halostella litorea TaxID=2528831 RepID=UPI001092ADFA|nr:hypothetical protein [Halostella litorea]